MRALTSHLVTLATAAVLAAGYAFTNAAPRSDREGGGGLAPALAAATGLEIRGVPWLPEPDESPGRFGILSWHETFFVGGAPGKPADLYKAEIRVGPDDRLVAVKGLANLTNSPDGDDVLVAAAAPYVVVATRVLGQIRSLTILDLRGREVPRGGEWSLLQRLLARLTDLRESGRWAGLSRSVVRFGRPPEEVRASVVTNGLAPLVALAWKDVLGNGGSARVDPAAGRSTSPQLEVVREERLPKRPVLWLVDTARAMPFIGPGPIEWAEERVFALKDRYMRMRYALTGSAGGPGATQEPDAGPPVRLIRLAPGLEVGAENPAVGWPPKTVVSPAFSDPQPGEGVWRPATLAFTPVLPGAPPSVYRTFVRTDRQRPYVRVELLAMDMRQLELHMVGGFEDPKSTTGSCGTGRIPRDPDLLPRVVAAFNGAFKTEHGSYGMMVDRNVLLPPVDDAATVARVEGGRTLMGSWPRGMPLPQSMISFRQNMDPLVEGGVVNPRRRYLWGFTLGKDFTQMNTDRSGLCMTPSGALVYAWGEDLSAQTLGAAMNAAGCTYGMHLDMNPYHTAYIFYGFKAPLDPKKPEFESKMAIPAQQFSPLRYVNGAPKDFFFVALRGSGPEPGWSAEGLAQPAPAFVPALVRDASRGPALWAIDLRRARSRLTAGKVPEALKPAADKSDDEALLAQMALGAWSAQRGQMSGGAVLAEMREGAATLVVREDGSLAVGAWPIATVGAPGMLDAVQGEWLVRDGHRSEASGEPELVAAGVGTKGWLVLGCGPRSALADAMIAAHVSEAVAFPSSAAVPSVLVRGASGMMDAEGRPVSAVDALTSMLRLTGSPVPLAATRIEATFAPGYRTPIDAKPTPWHAPSATRVDGEKRK
ncbi:MAG: hypothetical protein PHU25_08590 [Deltaproteobacteria bacterium]|nr:hypothetical protein [Deltaproteobacteria bacterium]